jgi:uncharacterized protein (DUF58 family)
MKGFTASAIVLALIVTSLPPPARADWHQQPLPGTIPTGAVVGAAAAGAALIGLLVYSKLRHRGATHVKLDAPPVRFDNATPGQPVEENVPVTNMMSDPITVKSLVVEDPSNAFTVSDAFHVPFTIAPGEKAEIPVTLSATNGGAKARLRIVASAPNLEEDATKVVSISYGRPTSKMGKLLHRQ